MVKLASALSRLDPVKVMVMGDLLVDLYTIGKARRISPEAPVAVIHVESEESRPGGAGNVILNLISLGAQVVPFGRVGPDWAGQMLLNDLQKEGINTETIVLQEGYKTPIKNRIIAENQQVVRVDHEQMTALPQVLESQLIDNLPVVMKDVQVVAISDYGKGFLTVPLLRAVIAQARRQGTMVIADPKGHDFTRYEGVTIIKPNLSEAYLAAGLPFSASLEHVSQVVLGITKAEMLMITRSESGISLFKPCGERNDFPVHVKEIKDVTGAGDTVLAMLTSALANGLPHSDAAQLCNVAAGIAIERLGCARITLSDLAERLLEMNPSNKVFDENHLFALQEVLRKSKFKVLTVSARQGLNPALFQTIKLHANKENGSLLIYVKDSENAELFVEMLASLKEVDFILLHEESLRRLCDRVKPEAFFEVS